LPATSAGCVSVGAGSSEQPASASIAAPISIPKFRVPNLRAKFIKPSNVLRRTL
jgi:hypothetical protein